MKYEKENVESKKILDYLKTLDVKASNKHEEKEYDNYILSTVMITTTLNSDEYTVYMICQIKETNMIYGELLTKSFTDENLAEKYYNDLKVKMNSFSEEDINNLITTL